MFLMGGSWGGSGGGGGVKFFLDLRNCEIRFFLDYKQTNYLSGVRVVGL